MKRLCCRGVFYDYPQLSVSKARSIIHCTTLRVGQNDEVAHDEAQFNLVECS